MMPTPEAQAKFEPIFAELFKPDQMGNLPDPKSLPSNERLIRVATVRDAINAGYEPPEHIVTYVLDCSTIDRSERINASKKEGKKAKDIDAGPGPALADL